MRVIDNISGLKAIIRAQKTAGRTIGFVPTMGYLHEGHMSLARRSVAENDFTVMSIFVNPIQFGINEDFDKYPRDFDGDTAKAESCGVDVLFMPPAEEMYPAGYSTYVEVSGEITGKLCGKSRPGHFRGVATVVAKLFNIVESNRAYFGQKDAQQATIITKMARELDMNLEVVICPIVREADGLAMSSRNVYLNMEERKAALVLSVSLFQAEGKIRAGERNAERILTGIKENIKAESMAQLEYASLVNAQTLEDVRQIKGKVLIALAVKFGKTRLIDNITLEV
jgi:pantoate--beta-alanine ligase